jgi:hypothetical protein
MNFTPEQLAAMTDRPADQVTVVVIHHTAEDNQAQDITSISAEEIASMGFIAVGYHYVVQGDGTVQVGRPITKEPAANLGMNFQSVAISLEGNFEPDDAGYKGEVPSEAAMAAAIAIVNNWVKPKCPNLKYLIGHRDVAVINQNSGEATACPGTLLYNELDYFRRSTVLGADAPPVK